MDSSASYLASLRNIHRDRWDRSKGMKDDDDDDDDYDQQSAGRCSRCNVDRNPDHVAMNY
jgi:hypothetical protein